MVMGRCRKKENAGLSKRSGSKDSRYFSDQSLWSRSLCALVPELARRGMTSESLENSRETFLLSLIVTQHTTTSEFLNSKDYLFNIALPYTGLVRTLVGRSGDLSVFM